MPQVIFVFVGLCLICGFNAFYLSESNTADKLLPSPADNSKATTSDTIQRGIYEMSTKINNHLGTATSDNIKNTVFSPLSIATMLAQLHLAGGAKTKELLNSKLGFAGISQASQQFGQFVNKIRQSGAGTELGALTNRKQKSRSEHIHLANGIFIRNGFALRSDYRTSAEAIYQSEIDLLDLQRHPDAARKFINDWVKRNTNGMIDEIVPEAGIGPDANMVMAGSIYFKGFWAHSFLPGATSKRTFYADGRRRSVLVDMMATAGHFLYHKSSSFGCRVLRLSSANNTTATYIILPSKSTPAKIRQLQSRLSHEDLEAMISAMNERLVLVNVPKLRLKGELNLKEMLQNVGVNSIFSRTESDLEIIAGENAADKQFVDDIFLGVGLVLDESGTDGAAVLSRKEFDVEFVADSPFLVLVRHEETKLDLVWATVVDPRAQ